MNIMTFFLIMFYWNRIGYPSNICCTNRTKGKDQSIMGNEKADRSAKAATSMTRS